MVVSAKYTISQSTYRKDTKNKKVTQEEEEKEKEKSYGQIASNLSLTTFSRLKPKIGEYFSSR